MTKKSANVNVEAIPCKQCRGRGSYPDVHNWSDGPGVVDCFCGRCSETGIEPLVDDLLDTQGRLLEKLHTATHAAAMTYRHLLEENCKYWQVMEACYRALPEHDRGYYEQQAGRRYCPRRKRVVEIEAA
jgi:hypothetical protein